MGRIEQLVAELSGPLDAAGILRGEEVRQRPAGIWRDDHVRAPVIFRPRDTQGVSAVLSACHAADQPVVVHGGLTGLAEGAIAGPDDVVLSTERMRSIEHVDPTDRLMQVQAGVTLQAAQDAAEESGLMLALDLGARGSCTLGGNAATNAGGNRVLRYGMMREQVLGIEAVLADGTVLTSLNGMLKNNAGYDLRQWFVGTEGTLGVITRLVLRLRPAWRSQETALLACGDFPGVSALLAHFDRDLGGTLSAFELLWHDYYALVAGDEPPLDTHYPYYVLVEALGSDPDSDRERFLRAVTAATEHGFAVDGLVCKSGAEREALWAMRDGVERTLEEGPAMIFDVSLRLSEMEAYVDAVRERLQARWGDAHRNWVFGHAGDGNLHFVIRAGDGGVADRHAIEACVYEPLLAIDGSISGEHGIGLEKKAWLLRSRDPAELAVMRRLKDSLDPRGILNPGRVFDLYSSNGHAAP